MVVQLAHHRFDVAARRFLVRISIEDHRSLQTVVHPHPEEDKRLADRRDAQLPRLQTGHIMDIARQRIPHGVEEPFLGVIDGVAEDRPAAGFLAVDPDVLQKFGEAGLECLDLGGVPAAHSERR